MARVFLQVNDVEKGTATVPPEYTPNGTAQEVTPCQLPKLQGILRDMKPYESWNKQIADVHNASPDTFLFGRMPDSESASKRLISSARFQILNFMAEHPTLAFDRDGLEAIQEALCDDSHLSNDVIQMVNKTDQRGMMGFFFQWDGRRWYCLPTIRVSTDRVQARTGRIDVSGFASSEREARAYFASLATEPVYERGHMDPYKPADDSNIVPQPASLNGGWRNQYRLDRHGLPFSHSPEFLRDNPDAISRYYSIDDCVMMIQAFSTYLGQVASHGKQR